MYKSGTVMSAVLGISIGLFFGMCHVISTDAHQDEKHQIAHTVQEVVIEKPVQTTTAPVKEKWDPDIPEDVQIAANYYGFVYNICPEFLEAVAFYESSYISTAENGPCKGLMQINIDAQYDRMAEMGITEEDLWDPYKNMAVAADYLAELFDRYEDCAVVLMKYNGDSRVWEYTERGDMSIYAANVLALAAELEAKHGKLDMNGRGGVYGGK